MSYSSRYVSFNIADYEVEGSRVTFHYNFDEERFFQEVIDFKTNIEQSPLMHKALLYVHVALGTSYYKLNPTQQISVESTEINQDQAAFFDNLYKQGLGQLLFENKLSPEVIGSFSYSEAELQPLSYNGEGNLLMQSGGKDSLLAAELLKESDQEFSAWNLNTTGKIPEVINQIGAKDVLSIQRHLDLAAIESAVEDGGLNGHVPFSAMLAGLALISAIAAGKNIVIAANESSSDEPNAYIEDFAVNHMYSKTFEFEELLQAYIHEAISPDLDYVSLLRPFSELKITRLFSEKGFKKYTGLFSSCNVANYRQGQDDGQLTWCGECAKCANAYLLFAPFIEYEELNNTFAGKNLLADQKLLPTFKALLGIDGIKPFECVGTVEELQYAYELACEKDERFCNDELELPSSNYREEHGEHQELVSELINL